MLNIYLSRAKISPLDIEGNAKRAQSEIDCAKKRGAKLIVFPQGFLSGVQLGAVAGTGYFADMYNHFAKGLAKENSDIYILADLYNGNRFINTLFCGEKCADGYDFVINDVHFSSFDSVETLRNTVSTIHNAGCIIINESKGTIAGQRTLYKKLMSQIYTDSHIEIVANLGGYGFTSHPYVYMPCFAHFAKNESVFTQDMVQYLGAECLYAIEGKSGNGSMCGALTSVRFETEFKQNAMIPSEVEQAEYCLDLFSLQTKALADRIANIHAKNVVVALSGGLDSTTALLVTANAFDLLGMDRKGIYALSMPGFGTSNTTKNLAKALCEDLGIDYHEIDITPACTQALSDIGHDGITADTTFENVQARMRTLNALNITNMRGGFMVGTGDLSEEALGFSTYGGDHLAGYNVNSSLSKTVMRTMLPYVAEKENLKSAKDTIYQVLNIPVSPELIPYGGQILQKTEEILAPYILIDFFIYCFIVAKLSPQEAIERAGCVFEGRFTVEYLKEKCTMFYKKFILGQFKRSCAPEGAILTHVALYGENSVPSDSSADIFNYYINI